MVEHHPIFIVGMPRSGTTLLATLLSAHPGISILPETHLLTRWLPRRWRRGEVSLEELEAFWKRYAASQRFSFLGVDAGAVWERVRSLMGEGSVGARTLLLALMLEHGSVHRKPRVGEKTPGHNRHLSTLLRWFPDSTVLFLVRDPRDVVASLLDTPWGSRLEADRHALEWLRVMRRLDGFQEDSRVRPVHYEALVEDPETEMESVCSFLGETFDPAMTEAESRGAVEGVSREGWAEGHLEKARGPITDSSVGRWRERLNDRQIRIVEDVVGEEMELWGYHPATDGLPFFSSKWSALTRLGRRARGWIRRRNRPQNER